MARKARTLSETDKLAIAFHAKYIGGEWDYRTCRRWLAEAKELVNPPADKNVKAYSTGDILNCLSLLEEGFFDFDGEIKTLRVVLWGEPKPYIQQYLDWKVTPPPAHIAWEVKKWEQLTGNIAYPEELRAIMISAPTIPNLSLVEG